MEGKPFNFNFVYDEKTTQEQVYKDIGHPAVLKVVEGLKTCIFAYGQTGSGKSFTVVAPRMKKKEGPIPEDQKGLVLRVVNGLFDEVKRLNEEGAKESVKTFFEARLFLQSVEVYAEKVYDLLTATRDISDRVPMEIGKTFYDGTSYDFPVPAASDLQRVWEEHVQRADPRDLSWEDLDSKEQKRFLTEYVAQAEVHKYCKLGIYPIRNSDEFRFVNDYMEFNKTIASTNMNDTSSRAHTIYGFEFHIAKRGLVDGSDTFTDLEITKGKLRIIDLAGSEKFGATEGKGALRAQEGIQINKALSTLALVIRNCANASLKQRAPFRDSVLTMLLESYLRASVVSLIACSYRARKYVDETKRTLQFATDAIQIKTVTSANKQITDAGLAQIKAEEEISRLRAQLMEMGGGGDSGMSEKKKELEDQLERMRRADEEAAARAIAALEQQKAEFAQKQALMRAEWEKQVGSARLRQGDTTVPYLVNLHENARLSETLVYELSKPTQVFGRPEKTFEPDVKLNGVGIMRRHVEISVRGSKVFLKNLSGARTLVNGSALATNQEVQLKHKARVWLGTNCALKFLYPDTPAFAAEVADAAVLDPDVDVSYEYAESEASKAMREQLGIDDLGDSALEIAGILRDIDQANAIAKDLGRDYTFEARLVRNRRGVGTTDVVVHVLFGSGSSLHWDLDQFQEKTFLLGEQWEKWRAAGSLAEQAAALPDVIDEEEQQLVGEAQMLKSSLAHMIQSELRPPIISLAGETEGHVAVELWPVDSRGTTGPWDTDSQYDFEPFVDSPEELLGQDITVEVRITALTWGDGADVQSRFKNVYIRWCFDVDDDNPQWFQTETIPETSNDLRFKHKQRLTMHVTPEVLERLQDGCVVLEVWSQLDKDSVAKMAGNLERVKAEKRKQLDALEAEVSAKETEVARLKALLARAKQ